MIALIICVAIFVYALLAGCIYGWLQHQYVQHGSKRFTQLDWRGQIQFDSEWAVCVSTAWPVLVGPAILLWVAELGAKPWRQRPTDLPKAKVVNE